MSNSLAEKMRARLNKRAERTLAQEITSTEELTQVDSWIEMPEYFRRATGAKGIPVGHITQVVGKSDTGKTTLVMEVMLKVQQTNGIIYLIDSEHKFSFERFKIMGGKSEDLIIMPVDSLEAAWNAIDVVNEDVKDFRKSDQDTPVLIVWDSVAASVPDRILEADAEQAHVSVDAKINNINFRKLRKRIRDAKIAALFINHTYMTMPKFGIAEEVVKGGSECYFMSTLILKTKRRGDLKRTVKGIDEKYGVHSLLEVKKGHLGGSKAVTPFYIVGQGILPDEASLNEYKGLIEGIPGPEINSKSLEELRGNKPVKAVVKGKASKTKEVLDISELEELEE